jgi:hypothetical protein
MKAVKRGSIINGYVERVFSKRKRELICLFLYSVYIYMKIHPFKNSFNLEDEKRHIPCQCEGFFRPRGRYLATKKISNSFQAIRVFEEHKKARVN